MKYRVLTFLLVMFFGPSYANSDVIDQLLQSVKDNASQVKIAEQNFKASSFDILGQRAVFSTTGYAQSSYANEETPPTSPFAPSSSVVKEYEAGVQKLWQQGIQSSLTYMIRDSRISFPTSSDFTFVSPTLTLSLSTSLVQDLYYDRYAHFSRALDQQQASLSHTAKKEVKQTLVQSLLDFTVILDEKEEWRLQKELCASTRKQAQNLAQKRKRGSVSKRLYYLSLKDLSNCEAAVEQLGRLYVEHINAFEANYNTNLQKLASLEIDGLFNEAQKAYETFHNSDKSVNLEQQDDIKGLNMDLAALQSKQKELEAKTKVNVSLELRSGLSGIDEGFSRSQQDVFQAEYPFVYAGLKLDLPLKNNQAVQAATANYYRVEATKNRVRLVTEQKQNRLATLESTLKKDFVIYSKFKRSVDLSKKVIAEANRDFKNGRLNFNDLSDFNKALIGDQKNLSSHRIQLIVRVVEYLDFFNYFDRYFVSQ